MSWDPKTEQYLEKRGALSRCGEDVGVPRTHPELPDHLRRDPESPRPGPEWLMADVKVEIGPECANVNTKKIPPNCRACGHQLEVIGPQFMICPLCDCDPPEPRSWGISRGEATVIALIVLLVLAVVLWTNSTI